MNLFPVMGRDLNNAATLEFSITVKPSVFQVRSSAFESRFSKYRSVSPNQLRLCWTHLRPVYSSLDRRQLRSFGDWHRDQARQAGESPMVLRRAGAAPEDAVDRAAILDSQFSRQAGVCPAPF